MRHWLALAFTFLLFACNTNTPSSSILILNYDEFGPQVIAYEIIGMQWWQWQSHGDSRPRKYDIKVAVYKNTNLQTVKEKYPVIPEKEQDYRYLHYDKAMDYLNSIIKEDAIPRVTKKLKETREKLSKM